MLYVYCPMCEMRHPNNSQCQRNDIMQNEPYKNLINFAEKMVEKYGHYDRYSETYCAGIDDLSEGDLGEFAALCLEYDDRDTTDCFNQTDKKPLDDDITIALLRVLKNNSYETRDDMARMIRTNTIARYKNFMEEKLSEASQDYTDGTLQTKGMISLKDRDSGDYIAIRGI